MAHTDREVAIVFSLFFFLVLYKHSKHSPPSLRHFIT